MAKQLKRVMPGTRRTFFAGAAALLMAGSGFAGAGHSDVESFDAMGAFARDIAREAAGTPVNARPAERSRELMYVEADTSQHDGGACEEGRTADFLASVSHMMDQSRVNLEAAKAAQHLVAVKAVEARVEASREMRAALMAEARNAQMKASEKSVGAARLRLRAELARLEGVIHAHKDARRDIQHLLDAARDLTIVIETVEESDYAG